MTTLPFGYAKLDNPEVLKYLFHPRRQEHVEPPAGVVDFDIAVEDAVVLHSRFFLSDIDAPNILFFHGNGEIVEDYDPIGPQYVEQGISFFIMDYRGYGKSGGTPSVTSMMKDAHGVFAQIKDWLKAANREGPLIVMGRSLGSACAIDLAASYGESIAGLIVESGFARTVPLLQCLGIDTETFGITEADGFKNVDKIQNVSKPTLIIHARHDLIIPVMDAEVLQMECIAKNKAFHMIPGADHNNIMVRTGRAYFELIKGFTNNIQGIRPKHFFRRARNQRKKEETAG
jgi:alpha-beta hydrolase superfamily lysophospholipase